MRSIYTAALTGASLFFALPATAQVAEDRVEQASVQVSDPPAEQGHAREDEAIECKNLAPKVGTRIPGRRVCLPVYQWEEWERTTRETADEVEMRGRLFRQ